MSDLTEAHRRTFQSLAKAINTSLHKRKWGIVDDEKREHYRQILKAMAADEENYNQDTVDRLKKKLDRVKKKMTAATSGTRSNADKLDGNILIVTCAAAQSWFMGEIVDGKKWDGEKKVLYEVKGQ